ncbi:MAG: CHAT domain-containing protein [Syntrophales bacterium]|nr:CHAT domain-containing protein [Syntrophales bacterium]
MKKVIIIPLIALFAIALFRPALCRSKPEAVNEAFNLYQQGQEASQYGMYQEALSYFKKSLQINRKLNILRGISANLNEIGMAYDSLGHYDKALSRYEEALKIDRKLNTPQDIAIGLNNIATVYESLGQYDRALKCHEEALKIKRQLNVPQDIALTLGDIALVHARLGQYDKALASYEEALKIDRGLKQGIVGDLENIGSFYSAFGQYDKALASYEEALKIKREQDFPAESTAITLDNIGFLYLARKEYVELEKRFLNTEKEWEKKDYKGIKNTPLIEFYLATGRHGEALKILKGITLGEDADDASRIQLHMQYGLALRGNGMLEEASSELLKAVSLAEGMGPHLKEKPDLGETVLGDSSIRAYKSLVATLCERALHGEKADKKFSSYGKDLITNAFYFTEAAKARVFLEATANSAKRYSRGELPLKIRKEEGDILNQLSAIENHWEEIYLKYNEEAFKRMVKRKENLRKKLASLVFIVRNKYPLYAALNYPQPVPPEKLSLKDNEILLEYALGSDAGYIFKVSKAGVETVIKIPQGKEELEKQVLEFVLPLHAPETKDNFSPTSGNKLYKVLLEEALRGLPPDKDIIIIPDGILGLLPFEALVTMPQKDLKDAAFVGDSWKISYYQSAAVLALSRTLEPSQGKKPLFALRDLILDKKDLRNVAGIGKEPVLALSQKTGAGKDDVILTLNEVLDMKLEAETVVLRGQISNLSPLTGWGKTVEGEGVLNFSRAFHYAGARSVVVSLWKSAPKETIAYMGDFYRCIGEGKTGMEALILARREVKSKYPNPFYWASFILHGER